MMTRSWTFRGVLSLAVLAGVAARPPAMPASSIPKRILVLTSAPGDAYGEALAGLRSALKGYAGELEVVDLSDASTASTVHDRLNHARPDAAVAVGTKALAAAGLLPSNVPVVSTMMFRSEATADKDSGQGLHAARVSLSLDVPLASLLAELKAVLPSMTRAGMIRNPRRPGPSVAALRAEAKQAGFTLQVRDCDKTDELLRVFLSFRDEVDFVWCPPESSLFNSSTIKPLILASIRNGLPIVGFSENFVRAGAAIGVYPDYADVGRQTGELIRMVLDHTADHVAVVSPRLWRVALNGNVARMLGLRYSQPPSKGESRFQVLR